MKIKYLLIISVALNCTGVACGGERTHVLSQSVDNSNSQATGAAVQEGSANHKFSISKKYRATLLNKGFVVQAPEDVEASKMIDNMWQLKKFFEDKNSDIFKYTRLKKYHIVSKKNKSSATLYCFHFDSRQAASDWYSVIDKTRLKGQLKIVFRRPKKMLALLRYNVILVEGYRMSDYEALKFIVTNLDGVSSILDPNAISLN